MPPTIWLALSLVGCRSTPSDSDGPADTDLPTDTDPVVEACEDTWSCDPLEECFNAISIRTEETFDFNLGTALTVATEDGTPFLVVTAPGSGRYNLDYTRGSSASLFHLAPWPGFDPDYSSYTAVVWEPVLDDGEFPPAVPRLGGEAVVPGDITGDGMTDLVLFEDTEVGEVFGNVLVFPGPLVGTFGRGHTAPGTLTLVLPGATHGAPCGDLDGDGVAELCLATGVLRGPVIAEDAVDVPLPPGGELLPQNASRRSPGFALWTPATQTIAWVDGMDASGLRVARSSGPVAGAPFAWSVVPTADGAVLLFATEAGGGHTVSVWEIGAPAPRLQVPFAGRPAALAYADVTGDGTEDVLVSSDSEVTILDGQRALSGEACSRGVLSVPVRDAGLGEEMLVIGPEEGGPAWILGAPRDDRTTGVPGTSGAVYMLRLPLATPGQ